MADHICCHNKHYAEPSGFLRTVRVRAPNIQKLLLATLHVPTRHLPPGKVLFAAQQGWHDDLLRFGLRQASLHRPKGQDDGGIQGGIPRSRMA